MSNVPQAPQPQDNALEEFAGRNYARFALQHGIHCVPIDEPEEVNYDQVNDLFNLFLGRPILPALNLHEVDEPGILDCGYGKGAWIDTVLNTYTDAIVIGTDIYTGQGNGSDSDDEEEDGPAGVEYFVKERWNLNASFRTARDSELSPASFHLINSRFLTDGINRGRWDSYVKELKSLLKPKGWLQMVEVHMLFQSDSGLLNRDTSLLHRWWDYYRYTLELMGKDPRAGQQLGALMQSAGFEEIQASVMRLPIGNWMEGKELVGMRALQLISNMLRSSTTWTFRRVCQPPMTEQQYEALIQGARAEMSQPGLKLYLNIYVAYGRRPAARRR